MHAHAHTHTHTHTHARTHTHTHTHTHTTHTHKHVPTAVTRITEQILAINNHCRMQSHNHSSSGLRNTIMQSSRIRIAKHTVKHHSQELCVAFCPSVVHFCCVYGPFPLLFWCVLTYYLCPSLPVERRPSTTPRHCTLFWTDLAIPDQLVLCCFNSASVSSLQLLRGRPLFLFPCGFQVRAWCVVLDAGFLRVCTIHPHFLHSICLATGSCPTRFHRSSFRILSCHRILCWCVFYDINCLC